jgi:hypothetical protein
MQDIPIIDSSYPVNLSEFITVIILLFVVIIILGFRNHVTKLSYWMISIAEVIVFTLLWLFLAEMVHLAINTYTTIPVDSITIIIDTLNILSFLGFCILMIVIEKYRGLPETESETGIVTIE